MSNEWFQAFIATAIFLLGCVAGTVGWYVNKLVDRVEDVAQGLDELRDKHGKEIRNTRAGVSYMAGQLKLPEPHYDD